MSINSTNILPNGFPAPFDREVGIRSQNDVSITLTCGSQEAGNYARFSATGTLFLSNYRITFISSSPMAQSFRCCELPLMGIADHDYSQPVFGASEITGSVRSIPGRGLHDPVRFRLSFNGGGSHEFLTAMEGALERSSQTNTQQPQQPPPPPPQQQQQTSPALRSDSFSQPGPSGSMPFTGVMTGQMPPGPAAPIQGIYPHPMGGFYPPTRQQSMGVPPLVFAPGRGQGRGYGPVVMHVATYPPQYAHTHPQRPPPHMQNPAPHPSSLGSLQDPRKCAFFSPSDPFTVYIIDDKHHESPMSPSRG
eukprot:TRINITY_DN7449_c1_g8_i1.p1 TRINITY_DN7449_c1_g8~~TRINITY_DN7449_c1_g8_i1.p1  ORF type:complete len:306 (-),score=65.29 TRINITY_DN7449_c1_g8_i1:663-1580(-)